MTDNTTLAPAAFIGHGAPTNALEDNHYTRAWRDYAAGIARPSAVLVLSAHWYVGETAVTAMALPRTIHDFIGFAPELFAVRYDAPGDPALAERVAELVKPTRVDLDRTWGLDHGTWSVLRHLFPEADVPVVQLSLNATEPYDFHFELGSRLHQLRREGVMILASGNVVHNLSLLNPRMVGDAPNWAHRVDDAAREAMTTDPSTLGATIDGADFALAAPTPEHFLPLVYLAGLASASRERATSIVEGYEMGALSMSAYQLVA